MADLVVKYWEDGKHILVESDGWDCFIKNEDLDPMINWINLHCDDIKNGKLCSGKDRINDIEYSSIYGGLMIKTYRDVVFLSKEQVEQFVHWLNEHRSVLNIREIVFGKVKE